MQAELEGELDGQLATFGIDPNAGQLSDAEYAEAMAELKRRRVAAMANMTPEEQAHIQYKRSTILWHAHAVRICGFKVYWKPKLT